jgi:hypothetical protein
MLVTPFTLAPHPSTTIGNCGKDRTPVGAPHAESPLLSHQAIARLCDICDSTIPEKVAASVTFFCLTNPERYATMNSQEQVVPGEARQHGGSFHATRRKVSTTHNNSIPYAHTTFNDGYRT